MPKKRGGGSKSSGQRNYARARQRLLIRRARFEILERTSGIDRESRSVYKETVEVAAPQRDDPEGPVIATLLSETSTFPTFTNTVGAEPCPPQEHDNEHP